MSQPEILDTSTDYVIDSNETSFMEDVIDASSERPVIVDFWAPWCGPCRTLMPALEKAVRKHKGKIKLAKVNVDENQALAAQLRIQSIPTVYAFYEGRPIDAFQGAQTPSQLDQFVEKILAMAPKDPLETHLEAARDALSADHLQDAEAIFAQILAQEPQNPAALLGLAEVRLGLGDLAMAKAILGELDVDHASSAAPLLSKISLLEEAQSVGPLDEIAARVEKNPNDLAARFDLANALYAQNQTEAAIDALLEILKRDMNWNDGGAKDRILKFFESLDPKDPIHLKGRRKFSSLMFS